MNTMWIIVMALVVVVIVGVVVFGGIIIRHWMPEELSQVGDKVDIFTDGMFNRTATISGINCDRLYIYDTLPLPLDYRGTFYGMGTDNDGVEFWYLANRKHYFMVPFAEWVRKTYRQLSYPFNFCPVTSDAELMTAAQRQKEASQKLNDTGKEVSSPNENAIEL